MKNVIIIIIIIIVIIIDAHLASNFVQLMLFYTINVSINAKCKCFHIP